MRFKHALSVILILFINLIFTGLSKGQRIVPIDTLKTTQASILVADDNDTLYHVAYRAKSRSSQGVLVVSKQIGTNDFVVQDTLALKSVDSSAFIFGDTVPFYDAEFFNGTLYITGFVKTGVNGVEYKGGIQWSKAGFDRFIPGMDSLYIIGEIARIKNKLYFQSSRFYYSTYRQLRVYDGATITLMRNIIYHEPADMDVINDSILCFMTNDTVYKWSSSGFHFVGDSLKHNSSPTSFDFMTTDGKSLYYLTVNSIQEYNNGSTKYHPIPQGMYLYRLENHKNTLWAVGVAPFDSVVTLGIYENNKWRTIRTDLMAGYLGYYKTNHFYVWNNNFLLSHNNKLYICSNIEDRHIIAEIKSDGLSTVSGRIFFDLNSDCIYNSGDVPVAGNVVSMDKGIFAGNTDQNGNYAFSFFSGSDYTGRPQNELFSTYSCSPDSFLIINAAKDSTYTLDFPLVFDTSKIDFDVQLAAGVIRRGDANNYMAIYVNGNTLAGFSDSVKVQVTYDSRCSYVKNVSEGWDSTSGNKVWIKMKKPAYGQFSYTVLSFNYPAASLNVGDTVCMEALLLGKDSNAMNDTAEICRIIRGPYDPNVKESFPKNKVDKDIEKVSYTIEFQNIGTDYAEKVVVIDTVDTRLPVRYIKVTGTSHPGYYQLQVKNNVLVWTFDNIRLPAMKDDPEGSKGYITYEAKVSPEFRNPGDSIHNTAVIYFDFEAGIETNKASIFISDSSTSVQDVPGKIRTVHIYPNPTAGKLTVENTAQVRRFVMLYNINGQLVRELVIESKSSEEMDLSTLVSGIYFIRTSNGEVFKVVKN